LPRREAILICREPAAQAAPVPAPPGRTVRWDGRFTLAVPATAGAGLTLGALGDDALQVRGSCRRELPGVVRPTLPALRDAKGVVAVPHLGYDRDPVEPGTAAGCTVFYRPTRPLARAGFTVA
jgi:tRNA(Ile)-lysidine synthase